MTEVKCKRIAIIFSKAPYGTESGREGLDALLAVSNFTDDLAVFFIDDGVYQLLKNQTPEVSQIKNHSKMFKLMSLYDIESIFVSKEALLNRDLNVEDLLLEAQVIEDVSISDLLGQCSVKLVF